MKKMHKVGLSAALLAVSSAFAASIDSRVNELEKQMRDVRTETALNTFGARTASARAEVNGKGWWIMLGPVYEHARVGGTEFCYTDDDPAGALPIQGRTRNIDFSWDWGIRAGIGYNFEHDLWDAGVTYTYFSSSGSRSVTPGFNSSLVPLRGSANIIQGCNNFGSSAEFGFATNAKSQFDFTLHDIALELGRDYFVSKNLAIRPHFGLEADFLFLEQLTRYTGGSSTGGNGTPIGVNTVEVKEDSDYWGLGPQAGADTNWYLGSGFSIFGNAAGALLYGNFDVIHREFFSLCPSVNKIRVVADEHRFVPTAHLQLGFSYERYWDEHKNHIAIRLGYEAQYFWRANQMLKVDDFDVLKFERYAEDVAVHGVMLDVKWTF